MMSMSNTKRSAAAEIDFHKGETLMRLAGTYPTLQQSIKEAIQNALDSNAKRISVCISLKTRTYVVMDDGTGVSEDMFQSALRSVGNSIKAKDKLGRFGLGLISPLGKCGRFTFTSCASPHKQPFTEWRLETEAIRGQKETISIPVRQRTDLVHRPEQPPSRSVTPVWWRTEVAVFNFTEDRLLSAITLEGLEQDILNDYSEVMLKNKVSIAIEIVDEHGKAAKKVVRAAPFRGKAMPQVTIQTTDAGTVQFTMYLVRPRDRHSSRKVNVRFGELYNDFRFSFANFLRYNGAEYLASETIEGLRSGVFEGEILGEHVALTPARTCFEKNDSLLDLCIAIDQWFKEHGKQRLDEEKVRRSEVRYQELGIRSMRVVEDMLHRPENESLLKAMRESFGFGTIGVGHAELPSKIVDGLQDDTSQSLRGGIGTPRQEGAGGGSSGSGGKKGSKEKVERPGHVPLSVIGPKGQARRLVRGNSIGLNFDYQDLGASPALWELDRSQGVLTFNITHPIWVECDKEKRDWKVCALQEFVAMQALTLETMPDRAWYDHQRLYADEMVARFVHLLSVGAISKSVKQPPG